MKSHKKIFSREAESQQLSKILESNKSEMVVVYGRRRVGKTFLIREFFSKNKSGFYFELTGIKDGSTADQLKCFSESFKKYFYPDLDLQKFTNWREAFTKLNAEIHKIHASKKVILFIDELPWLATNKSDLLSSIDRYWNTEWSNEKRIKLILCGSAASWMIKKVLNSKGGLHNRVTHRLRLEPFNLQQTQNFLIRSGMHLDAKQICDLYMMIGGVPYYLSLLKKNLSIMQNLDQLCFQKSGALSDEISRLFASLFDDHQIHEQIIHSLAKSWFGLTREQILKQLQLKSGGWINTKLNELEEADFITTFVPYGKKNKDKIYVITDPFVRFAKTFLEGQRKQSITRLSSISKKPQWFVWAGYSFENICLNHIQSITKSLDLEGQVLWYGPWRYNQQSQLSTGNKQNETTEKAQIDLVIEGADDCLRICEIKYTDKEYAFEKDEMDRFLKRVELFKKVHKIKKQVLLVLITPVGLKETPWSRKHIDLVITLKDLFR